MSLNNRRNIARGGGGEPNNNDVQKFRAQPPGGRGGGGGNVPSDGKLFDGSYLDDASRQSVMRDVQGTSKPKSITPAQQQQIDELLNKKGDSGGGAYQRNTVGGMTPSQLAQMLRNEALVSTTEPPRRQSSHSVGVDTSTSTGGSGGGAYVLPTSPSRARAAAQQQSSSNNVPASSKTAPSTNPQPPPSHLKGSGGIYSSNAGGGIARGGAVVVGGGSKASSSPPTHQSHTIGGGGGDGELLGVMVQRLRTIENSQRIMQLELKEKSKKIIELEDKYAHERVARKEAEESKEALAQELSDVLEFLDEYGLSWVGKDVDEISDQQGNTRSRPSSTTSMKQHQQQGTNIRGSIPSAVVSGQGRVLGGGCGTKKDDEEDEDGMHHSNITQSNLPLGNGLVFDNSMSHAEEGRTRGGGRPSSGMVNNMANLTTTPFNTTQRPTAAVPPTQLQPNQRTVNTSTAVDDDAGPQQQPPRVSGFSLYDGSFDAAKTAVPPTPEGGGGGDGTVAIETSLPPSTLPQSVVAAQQQRHKQYLEERKQAGSPTTNGETVPAANININRPIVNTFLNARKLKKLPFSLERFVKNCGILSDHVGEKAFAALHSGDGPSSSSGGGGGAVGSSLPSGVPSNPDGNGGGGDRRRVLQEREKVYVAIYNDGICVNGGLFRPYGWPLCDAFLNDILDGFYPYEFKDKYPDGFPVEPLDHSREYHDAASSSSPSSGATTINQLNKNGMATHKPITKDQFLKNLPSQSITSGGKIVDVQAAVRGRFGGGGGGVVGAGGTAARALSTPLLSTIKGDTAASEELTRRHQQQEAPPLARQITTVQIRLPGGEKCVLHMFFQDTIANVRAEFKKAVPQMFPQRRGGSGGADDGWYEFRSMFPRVECTDHSLSLEALGLVPSCTLMLRMTNQE